MSPEEELKLLEELERLEALESGGTPAAPGTDPEAEQLAASVDPTMPVLPQVLALEPGTNHPGGEEAAKAEWQAGAGGRGVYVYEPPIEAARQELMSNPQLLAALEEGSPYASTPDYVAQMSEKDPLYRAYSDYKWAETAKAAAGSGNTAYRYSRMPWLGEGGVGKQLSQLLSKSVGAGVPALGGVTSFVMGADRVASFGAGKALGDATAPEAQGAGTPGKFDFIYSSGGSPLEDKPIEQVMEENPGSQLAGGVAGMFMPGSLAGKVWSTLGKAPTAAAGAVAARGAGRGAQFAARAGAALPTAAASGAVGQAALEATDAAGSLARTGDAGTTLGEAAGRVGEAAVDPINLSLGFAGELLGGGAGGLRNLIEDSPHYQGAVTRVKQLGGSFKFGKGPVGTPQAEEAIKKGKQLDVSGKDVVAQEAAPKVEAVERLEQTERLQGAQHQVREEDAATKALRKQIGEENEAYYRTPEGQQRIPLDETVNEELKLLREAHRRRGEDLTQIGGSKAPAEGLKAEFNADLDAISLEPVPGAVELTPDEADTFLGSYLRGQLLEQVEPPPRGGTPSGAPPPPVGEAPTVPPKGKAARPAGAVPVNQRTARTEVEKIYAGGPHRREYGEAMRPYREAQRADNLRAERLDAEFNKQGARVLRPGPERQAITPEARKDVMDRLEKTWTPAEKAAAQGHTSARFFEINESLRSGKPMSGETKANYDALLSSMDKAVGAGNTLPGKTQRGISVSQKELEQLEKAKTITAQGFVSQSDDPKIAKQFSEWGASDERPIPILFEIEQTSGVPVGKGQGELVHRPGTQYAVTGQTERDGVKAFQVRETGYSPGEKATGAIIGGGMLAVGAATGGEEGAAAASAGGLAMALKKKGISKVYAVPARYTAQEHWKRIKRLETLDPKSPIQREVRQIYTASLRDRDKRPMGGQAGAWSRKQQEQQTAIDAGKERAVGAGKEVTAAKEPTDPAHRRLVRYGSQREGELPAKQEMERLGARAGVTPELDTLRLLDPLEQLRGQMAVRRGNSGLSGRGAMGILGATADQGILRFGYPTLNALGSTTSPLRGGTLGARVNQLVEQEKEKR